MTKKRMSGAEWRAKRKAEGGTEQVQFNPIRKISTMQAVSRSKRNVPVTLARLPGFSTEEA